MERSFAENAERMRSMSYLVNRGEGALQREFTDHMREFLAKKGYRADLALVSRKKPVAGKSFPVQVKYNTQFRYPPENDLMALVAQAYPTYEIDWDAIQVDTDAGVVSMQLKPAQETIPIASIKEIPSEYVRIGTGIYKRAVDASGNISQIWELRRQPDGFALVRMMDDIEINAEEEGTGFKAGDVVQTEHGPGKITRLDGENAIVQLANEKRMVAQKEIKPYDINSEKQKLVDYLTQAYGDPEYAKELAEDYGDVVKERRKA